MTIREAIINVLKQSSRPLSIEEIYKSILEGHLYKFNSENAKGIIGAEIRRQSEGVESAKAKPIKIFVKLKEGKYSIRNGPLDQKSL